MDFQQLLAKMVELDQPQVESMPADTVAEQPVAECPPDMPSAMPSNMGQPETPPPSMSLNLNAQGMDNIEQLMKLVTKVNPDMEKPAMPPMPSLGMEPSIASIKPSLPPLKMLPDLDGDDDVTKAQGDLDNDGDHDMDDHDMEKKKDKEEAFANSLDDSEPDTMDMDAAIRDGDDLHKKKSMHKAAAGGDNAMAAESTDLRSQIRAELLQRLAEAKGAK
jgi:hypothetical protein